MCIGVQLSHFTEQQRLAQHRKSTTLQLKNIHDGLQIMFFDCIYILFIVPSPLIKD